MSNANWKGLDFGPLTKLEIREAIKSPDWQRYRLAMTGHSLAYKHRMLVWWLERPSAIPRRIREIQVTNYVNALKRGGMVI